jgi:hypothetical protein
VVYTKKEVQCTKQKIILGLKEKWAVEAS